MPSEEGEAMPEIAQRKPCVSEMKPWPTCSFGASRIRRGFAVYTSPRHEKRVDTQLGIRGMDRFLPLYSARRNWSDRSKVTLDLPLFPGYIFVRIESSERVRVLEVPGVLAILGSTGRETHALPGSEINALRTGLRRYSAKPHPYLAVGQRARIASGPLSGMVGRVVRQKNSLRIVLVLELIRQSMSVEVDARELEPIHSSTLSWNEERIA
jgi:transcription antitermination factor NusG